MIELKQYSSFDRIVVMEKQEGNISTVDFCCSTVVIRENYQYAKFDMFHDIYFGNSLDIEIESW